MSRIDDAHSSRHVPVRTLDGNRELSDADLESAAGGSFLSGVIKLMQELQREREIKYLKGELDHL